MTAILNVYEALTRTFEGDVESFGNLDTPINGGATITAGQIRKQQYSIIAGDTKVLWDFTQFTNEFTYFQLQIVGEGYLNVAVRHDSLSGGNPSGLARVWNHHNLTNISSFRINTRVGNTNVSAATYCGDTAGEPSLWATADELVGVVDRVMVRNQGTETVKLVMLIVGA